MKGIIVAAGYGTRFLPVTKTIPKEMLPLVNKPSISFIVEELIASGIREILIVSSRRKKALEDFLDREIELETIFEREGGAAKLKNVKPYDAEFFFTRQQEMKGTGHALLAAKPFVGNEPVVVAYPDDIHIGEPPLARQLVDLYEKTGCSVLATIYDPPDLHRYGILAIAPDNLHVKDMAEKPKPGAEPSREVSIGRYLYTPDFFDYLEEGFKKHLFGPNPAGEYYHLYALKKLMERNKVVYKRAEGMRLDTGDQEGFLQAILTYAAGIPRLRTVLAETLPKILTGQAAQEPGGSGPGALGSGDLQSGDTSR